MSSLRRTLEGILVLHMSLKVKAGKVNRRRSKNPGKEDQECELCHHVAIEINIDPSFRVRDFLRSTHLVTDFATIVIITIPDGFGPASEVSVQYRSHLSQLDAKDRS